MKKIFSLEEVIRRAKLYRYEEARRESEDYLELVIPSEAVLDFNRLLESFFGPALKPEGAEVTGEARRLAEPLGGIEKGQTLFARRKESPPAFAVIWPWEDGRRVTVKIAQGDLRQEGMS